MEEKRQERDLMVLFVPICRRTWTRWDWRWTS